MLNGFITNLGKYNEGILQGEWITFPISDEDLEEVFDRIGINEEYEEFFFTDWEDEDGLYKEVYEDSYCGQFASIEEVNELAEAIEDLDATDIEHLQAYIEATGYGIKYSLDNYEDSIYYTGMTLEDVAYEIAESYNLPEFAQRYFDYEAFARDLGFDGYTEVENGTICIC